MQAPHCGKARCDKNMEVLNKVEKQLNSQMHLRRPIHDWNLSFRGKKTAIEGGINAIITLVYCPDGRVVEILAF